jgi:hypothetical protein
MNAFPHQQCADPWLATRRAHEALALLRRDCARASFVSEPRHLPAVAVGKALNGAPLDLDPHAVPGLLARSDKIKVSCAGVRIPRSRCYGAAGRNADFLGRE